MLISYESCTQYFAGKVDTRLYLRMFAKLIICSGASDAVSGPTDQAKWLLVMLQEDVDTRALSHLSDEDLIYLGVSDAAQRRRLLQAARDLKKGAAQGLAKSQGPSQARLSASAPQQGTAAPLGTAQRDESGACLALKAPAPCSAAPLRGSGQDDSSAAEHSCGEESDAAPVRSIHSDMHALSSAGYQQGHPRGVQQPCRGLKRTAPGKAASMPLSKGQVSVKQPGSRALCQPCHSHKPDSKPDPGWAEQPCPAHLGRAVSHCLGTEPCEEQQTCPQQPSASSRPASAEAVGQPNPGAKPEACMSGALGHLLVSR